MCIPPYKKRHRDLELTYKSTMSFSFRLAAARDRKRSKTVVKPAWNLLDELLMEIIPRLPAKSLMRFKCVSRLWHSLITSRYLTNRFLKYSSSSVQRSRMLMSFVDSDEPYKYALISSSHDPVPLISPFYPAPMYDLDQDLTMPRIGGCFVSALRGLLCVRLLRSVRICNLTTMQRVTLPIITSRIVPENNENIWSYFGHEPVHDEYKVLSTVWEVSEEEKVVRSEHQVLVLGHGASWRSTRSTIPPPPHCPYMHGISINGVLYYGAWVDKNRCVVMSFDMRYEEFTLIELPVEAGIVWDARTMNLMNYKGKLAVFEYSSIMINGSIDLWFVQDAGKSGWSDKKSFVLPIFETRTLSMASRLLIQPTSHSSEICLKPEEINRHNPRCVIYDLERCKITRLINGMRIVDRFWGSTFMQTTFWDDIESIMYLET